MSEHCPEETKYSRLGRRLALFFLPILISAGYISLLWLILPDAIFLVIGALILSYFISPFGREVLIPTAIIGIMDVHPVGVLDLALVASSVVFVDIMCSLFLIWNIDLLKKVPKLGGLIRRFEEVGRGLLRRRKKKKLATFGLGVYVSLPFQGSGGVASTIIGLMAGIPRRNVFLAVAVGSIVGCTLLAIIGYYIAETLVSVFGSSMYYLFGVLVLASIFIFLIHRYWLHKQSYKL